MSGRVPRPRPELHAAEGRRVLVEHDVKPERQPVEVSVLLDADEFPVLDLDNLLPLHPVQVQGVPHSHGVAQQGGELEHDAFICQVLVRVSNEPSQRFHNHGEDAFNQEKALVGAFSVIVNSSGTFG